MAEAHALKQTNTKRTLIMVDRIHRLNGRHARTHYIQMHSRPTECSPIHKPSSPKKPLVETLIFALTRAHLVAVSRQAARPPAACADFPATELIALILLCIRRSG